MRRMALIVSVLAMGLAGSAQALDTYSGSLSVAGGGLVANGMSWGGTPGLWTPLTELSWTVMETSPGTWHYHYVLTVPAVAVGRLIIEARPTFTLADVHSLSGGIFPWIAEVDLGPQYVLPENLGMPEDMYGMRFDATVVSLTTVSVSFDLNRSPVWGDFYAQTVGYYCPANGQFQAPWLQWVHNTGFTAGDVDPADPAANGSIGYHLLVPGVPVPGAMLLGGLGLVLVSWLRRRGSV